MKIRQAACAALFVMLSFSACTGNHNTKSDATEATSKATVYLNSETSKNEDEDIIRYDVYEHGVMCENRIHSALRLTIIL